MFRHLEEGHIKAPEVESVCSLTLVHVHPRMGIPDSFSGLKKEVGRGTQENQEIQKPCYSGGCEREIIQLQEIVLGKEQLSRLQQERNKPVREGY